MTNPELTHVNTSNHNINRVAPNDGTLPFDTHVRVTSDEGYSLEFDFYPEGDIYRIFLKDIQPPLTDQVIHTRDVWVEGDVIIEGQELTLRSSLPVLAKTAFRVMRIESS